MKLKKSRWYGIMVRTRVGNRAVGALWRFIGTSTTGDLVFSGGGYGAPCGPEEFFKIPEDERSRYLVFEAS